MNIKIKTTISLATTMGCLALSIGSANAATVASTSFVSTSASVDLTSSNDWGYVSGGLFGANNATGTVYTYDGSGVANRHSSGAYGAVTLTENGLLGTKTDADFDATFTNGVSPTTGTNLVFGGGFGDFRAENLATFTFNDVGAGTHTIDIYYGTDRTGSTMDITTNIAAADGNVVNDTHTAVFASSGTYKYTLEFTTTDANADVTVFWDSIATGSGSSSFGPWVANVVPEPTTTALLGLGGLALILRRRK